MWGTLQAFSLAVYKLLTDPDVGTIASVIGLCISIYLLIAISGLKKRFLLIAESPRLVSKLKANLKNIENISKGGGYPAKLQTEISLCKANLESLSERVPKMTKRRIAATVSKIDALLMNFDADAASDFTIVIAEIHYIVQTSDNQLRDRLYE